MRPTDVATCVSCGLCLNDCPTYRVLGNEADSPRGRIQLIKTLVASHAPPDPSLVAHLDACLVCRACETVCPSLVPFGRIMEGAREEIAARERSSWVGRQLRAFLVDLVTHPRVMTVAAFLAGVYGRSGLAALTRRILPRRLAEMSALLAPPEGPPYAPVAHADADVVLFAGCVMRAAFGDTQRSTVRLLERAGHRVAAPAGQTCCGALHAHAGLGERARELARANIAAFRDQEAPIVVTAAGCGAHLKAYGDLLAADPGYADAAGRLARRVRDASEVVSPANARSSVVRARGARARSEQGRASGASGLWGPGQPLRVVYQDACHLAHGQGIRRQPRDLLRAIDGVELVPIADPERCCGSAGVYNLTHTAVATELQRQKAAAILAARPDVVVSANPGCILQIRAGLRDAGSSVPVMHLMRFLDQPAASLRDQD